MTDDIFEKTMEAWKQKYSGFTPSEKKDFEDSIAKCSTAVIGILNGSNKGLSPIEIQDAIKNNNLGLVLPFTIEKMESDGIIEPEAILQIRQPFPYSQKTYKLKR